MKVATNMVANALSRRPIKGHDDKLKKLIEELVRNPRSNAK
ncbi:hypothetical protein V6Z12_A11G340800 [Gossypium hirsutum]